MAIDEEQQIANLEATIRALPEGRVRREMEEALKRVTGESHTDGLMEIFLCVPGNPKITVYLQQNATVKDLRDAAAEKVGVEPDVFRFPGLPHEMDVPLVHLGMGNGTTVDMIVHPALLRLEKARIKHPHESPFEKFALALHCCCIESGFVCKNNIETSQQTPLPGFAPAVVERDMSNDDPVPVGWNNTPGIVSFEYRHRSFPGVTYNLKASMLATGEIDSIFGSNVNTGGDPVKEDIVKSLEAFQAVLQQFETSVLAHLAEQRRSPIPSNFSHTPVSPSPFPTAHFETPGMTRPGDGGDFPGDLGPDMGLGPVIGPVIGRDHGAGRGNLMGPCHPIFGEDNQGNLPQPRFDPYGPPMPGMPARPQGPNRPRPPSRRPFGDPNPDHLPPPGNDNMFL